MSTHKDQADKLIEEVTILQPSSSWPPELINNETVRFQGSFDPAVWMRKNVAVTAIVFGAIVTLAALLDRPITAQGMIFVIVLALIGTAITYAMYRKQSWIITNRAVYVNKGRPMLISSARKVVGFGSTVRLTGRWGVGVTLLGVQNAAEVRAVLQGRAT